MKKTIVSLFMVASVCLMHAQTTYYVKPNGAGTAGTTWEDALGTIAEAIAKAASGDQVFVAAGTYTQPWGALKKGVNIYGGFAGTETTQEQRIRKVGGAPYEFTNPTNITVNGVIINNGGSYTEAESLWVDGFSFRDCTHDNIIITVRGGMNFRNCIFANNVLNTPPTPPGTLNLISIMVTKISDTESAQTILADCLFEGNINHQNASILAINNNTAGATNTSAIVERSVFRSNVTDLASASTNANVINCSSAAGYISIRNSSFYNNSTKQAVFNAGTATEIVNCLVFNNTVGTNNVLLSGKMVNSLIANNNGRFCFNNNDFAMLYNTIVLGNTTGLAVNGTSITNFQVANNVIDKEINVGTYKDNVIVKTTAEALFLAPTSFVGAATNDNQLQEILSANWNIAASSPLVNVGLTAHFTDTHYGKTNNFDATATKVRYYDQATRTDAGALEAPKKKLTLALDDQQGQITAGATGYYMQEQTLTITAAPTPGYRLTAWKDEAGATVASTASFTYSMPNANKVLTALFEETTARFQLTVAAGTGGTVNTIGGKFFQDQTVQLVATPALGYLFTNWTDQDGKVLSTSNTFDFAMPGFATTLTANFSLKPADVGNTHDFDFEGLTINSQWQANDGSIAISEGRSQSGTQSLEWTTAANQSSKLTINLGKSFKSENTVKTCYFTLFNSTAIRDGKLIIRFYGGTDNATQYRIATQSMDFVGWREFERRYGLDFATKAPFHVFTKIEFELINPTAQPVKIYIDKVHLQQAALSANSMQSHWSILDADLFPSQTMLKTFAPSTDPTLPIVEPTAAELTALNLIRSRCDISPRPGNIEAARTFVKELNLTRNAQGFIVGTPILTGAKPLSENELLAIAKRVETLGHGALTSDEDKQLLNDYLDYIIEQGTLYRVGRISSSNYNMVRDMGQALTRALGACQTKTQTIEWARIIRWFMIAGDMYEPNYLYSQNSDVIYNFIEFYLAASVHIKDDAEAVRELKGLKRYMERCTEVTPGGHDIMKPDGTGFHHATHYPNYMYAYRGWCDVAYKLMGTELRIAPYAYENFKKAAIAMAMLATRGADNFIANSMGGRNPFNGNKLMLYKSNMENLSAIGGDIYGTTSDEELDKFVAYLYNTAETSKEYDGYYAFNWSPAGVYRHGNWVATMRSPTTKFWGSEIYSGRNRLGRYQSHGTLEVLYNYRSQASLGYPALNDSGWDWNVTPGGTTVHYTSWNEMLPGKNTTNRFDQFAKTKNFTGALPLGNSGIFAADFDQGDAWGVNQFASTDLVYKKSVFAFDGKLISLGSNISAPNTAPNTDITATNLFQSYKPTVGPNVNGTVLSPSTAATELTADSWIITPEGTGYYVPDQANDKITVKYGNQTSPRDDATNLSSPGTAVAAKAYINHGVTPTNKSYHFIVVPEATPDIMQAMATTVGNDGGQLYTIHSQDAQLHCLTYKPLNITGYAFFEANTNLTFGNVLSAASEMLLMEKATSESLREYSICNPNLRPKEVTFGWEATPTETSITVNGVWYIAAGSDKGFTVTNDGVNTTVAVTLVDGLPKKFNLSKTEDTSTTNPVANFRLWVTNGNVYISNEKACTVTAFNISGQLVTRSAEATSHAIRMEKGAYILQIQAGNATQNIKVVVP